MHVSLRELVIKKTTTSSRFSRKSTLSKCVDRGNKVN